MRLIPPDYDSEETLVALLINLASLQPPSFEIRPSPRRADSQCYTSTLLLTEFTESHLLLDMLPWYHPSVSPNNFTWLWMAWLEISSVLAESTRFSAGPTI